MSDHTLAVITAVAAITGAIGAVGAAIATAVYAYYTLKLWRGAQEQSRISQEQTRISQETAEHWQELVRLDREWKLHLARQAPLIAQGAKVVFDSFFYLAALGLGAWFVRELVSRQPQRKKEE